MFHDSFTGDIKHRGSSICSPKSLYKKTSQEILAELKAAFKTGASKVSRPRPVRPSLLRPICQACVNSQLSSILPSSPRERGKKNVTKMNFSSCNDHSPKWIINDCYIFFPYLRVWVFLFLWTSFFKAQNVGPMLHMDRNVKEENMHSYVTITHARIRAHTHTHTHTYNHPKTFLRNSNGFCLFFFRIFFQFSIHFIFLNCLMIFVLQKTP